jgi:hypothetical protein
MCPDGYRLLGFDRRSDVNAPGVMSPYYETVWFPGDAVCQQI